MKTMKPVPKSRKRRIAVITISLVILLPIFGLLTLQGLLLFCVQNFINDRHEDDYAVIRLNMGGQPAEIPNILKMLKTLHEYETSSEYYPQGSGGYTGKRNHLAILVSDNERVAHYAWTFKRFGLTQHFPSDEIDKILKQDREHYRFDPDHVQSRWGVRYLTDNFNNDDARFYPIEEGVFNREFSSSLD
jgi:hypothetical protein